MKTQYILYKNKIVSMEYKNKEQIISSQRSESKLYQENKLFRFKILILIIH